MLFLYLWESVECKSLIKPRPIEHVYQDRLNNADVAGHFAHLVSPSERF